jgi:hypothetical protein
MPNKESAKQERIDLGQMPGAYKQMDSAMPMMGGGSFMSQHSQSRMMSSGKPAAMNLMEKGKAVSSVKGSSNYMLDESPGDEPLKKGYKHSKKK